ncbi:MAG: hypothetical protein RJB13_1700 [Pseudomonadota bacterium]|jgi:pimeloyl-ACP methyl ester carboxylesterase
MHSGFEIETVTLPRVDGSQSHSLSFIEHDGAKIAYDYEAARSGVATHLLVLVNGFVRPRADFRAFRKRIHAQMPHLASLALDNRGAGDTEGGLEGLTVETMAKDAAFLAKTYASALSLSGYHALGISMGGMICQVWAACDPCVSAVTLVSTTAGGNRRVWPAGTDEAKAREKGFTSWPQDFESMHKRMVRYFGSKFRKSSPLLIEMMVKNMLKSQGEGSAHSKAEAQYNATVSFDGTGYAKRIVCPTLVLTGTEDEIIPKENADGLCSLILHAKKVELEAMGHLLLIEDPENFVASVRSFIEGQVVG